MGGRLPNLVIIGAVKCGTTSLHVYLARHPQIHMSAVKELDFFLAGGWGHWERGVDWYARHFDAPGHLVYGEASPRYTTWPLFEGVAERMASVIPAARLIYLVRDPIERMVSDWAMGVGSGHEKRPLEEALRDRDTHHYLSRSSYHLQLGRFRAHYRREQILVVDADELRHARRKTLREVFRFLGVDEGHASLRDLRRHNRTGRRLPEPSPELRAWLADELRDDVARLRADTGRSFSRWSL